VILMGGLRRPRTHCDDCGVLITNNNTRGNLSSASVCGKCYLAAKQRKRDANETG